MDVEGRIDAGTTGAPESEVPDAVLVRRILGGDDGALGALYRRHVGPIYRFVLAQVRNVQDAEDLTSETFARMLRGLSGFRGEASFRNWLYQIARNGVRNHRRAAGYRRLVPLAPSVAVPEPDDRANVRNAERDGLLSEALELLQRLPPRYRLVLELRFLEGMSIEQTAREMGVTVANAKVLQHRALKKAALMMSETKIEDRAERG